MVQQVLSSDKRQHTWFQIAHAFIAAEGRGLVTSVWRPMWKVGAVVAGVAFLALTYCALFLRVSVPDHDPPFVLILLTDLGFSVWYGVVAGFLVGLVNAGVRLVGNKFYFMLLVIAFLTLVIVGLCLHLIDAQGIATVNSLSDSAGNCGNIATQAELSGEQVFDVVKFIQLWPPVKVFAAPFLVPDCPQAVVDGEFLWQYFLYVRVWTLPLCLGFLPSYLFSICLLCRSGFARLRERYRTFVANYGVVTQFPSCERPTT